MDLNIQREGKIVSSMTLKQLRNGDIEIEYVRTDPAYRKHGFASILLKKAIAVADRKQSNLVGFIEPDKSNGLSYDEEIAWLSKYGFKRVAKYDFGGYYKPVMLRPSVR